jgi:hypothetical protein
MLQISMEAASHAQRYAISKGKEVFLVGKEEYLAVKTDIENDSNKYNSHGIIFPAVDSNKLMCPIGMVDNSKNRMKNSCNI